MSVSRLTGVVRMVFVYSSISGVLLDNRGISKFLNTLFLLSPQFCFIIVFICDLFVAGNDS